MSAEQILDEKECFEELMKKINQNDLDEDNFLMPSRQNSDTLYDKSFENNKDFCNSPKSNSKQQYFNLVQPEISQSEVFKNRKPFSYCKKSQFEQDIIMNDESSSDEIKKIIQKKNQSFQNLNEKQQIKDLKKQIQMLFELESENSDENMININLTPQELTNCEQFVTSIEYKLISLQNKIRNQIKLNKSLNLSGNSQEAINYRDVILEENDLSDDQKDLQNPAEDENLLLPDIFDNEIHFRKKIQSSLQIPNQNFKFKEQEQIIQTAKQKREDYIRSQSGSTLIFEDDKQQLQKVSFFGESIKRIFRQDKNEQIQKSKKGPQYKFGNTENQQIYEEKLKKWSIISDSQQKYSYHKNIKQEETQEYEFLNQQLTKEFLKIVPITKLLISTAKFFQKRHEKSKTLKKSSTSQKNEREELLEKYLVSYESQIKDLELIIQDQNNQLEQNQEQLSQLITQQAQKQQEQEIIIQEEIISTQRRQSLLQSTISEQKNEEINKQKNEEISQQKILDQLEQLREKDNKIFELNQQLQLKKAKEKENERMIMQQQQKYFEKKQQLYDEICLIQEQFQDLQTQYLSIKVENQMQKNMLKNFQEEEPQININNNSKDQLEYQKRSIHDMNGFFESPDKINQIDNLYQQNSQDLDYKSQSNEVFQFEETDQIIGLLNYQDQSISEKLEQKSLAHSPFNLKEIDEQKNQEKNLLKRIEQMEQQIATMTNEFMDQDNQNDQNKLSKINQYNKYIKNIRQNISAELQQIQETSNDLDTQDFKQDNTHQIQKQGQESFEFQNARNSFVSNGYTNSLYEVQEINGTQQFNTNNEYKDIFKSELDFMNQFYFDQQTNKMQSDIDYRSNFPKQSHHLGTIEKQFTDNKLKESQDDKKSFIDRQNKEIERIIQLENITRLKNISQKNKSFAQFTPRYVKNTFKNFPVDLNQEDHKTVHSSLHNSVIDSYNQNSFLNKLQEAEEDKLVYKKNEDQLDIHQQQKIQKSPSNSRSNPLSSLKKRLNPNLQLNTTKTQNEKQDLSLDFSSKVVITDQVKLNNELSGEEKSSIFQNKKRQFSTPSKAHLTYNNSQQDKKGIEQTPAFKQADQNDYSMFEFDQDQSEALAEEKDKGFDQIFYDHNQSSFIEINQQRTFTQRSLISQNNQTFVSGTNSTGGVRNADKEFFKLTLLAQLLNHSQFNKLKDINGDLLYAKALREKVPFNLYLQFVQRSLQEYYLLKVKNAEPLRFIGKEHELIEVDQTSIYYNQPLLSASKVEPSPNIVQLSPSSFQIRHSLRSDISEQKLNLTQKTNSNPSVSDLNSKEQEDNKSHKITETRQKSLSIFQKTSQLFQKAKASFVKADQSQPLTTVSQISKQINRDNLYLLQDGKPISIGEMTNRMAPTKKSALSHRGIKIQDDYF